MCIRDRIGYWLDEEVWGRGIATDALLAVTDYAFANFDLCRLYAHVFAWNPASARVLEKAGYSFEGRLKRSVTKDGQTIDQLMLSLIHISEPTRLLSISYAVFCL